MQRLLLLAGLLLTHGLYAQTPPAAPSLYDYRPTLRYARHLEGLGQYALAAREYERAWFLRPGDSVATLLLRAYRRDGNFTTGLLRAEQLSSPDSFSAPVAGEYLRLLLRNGGYQRAAFYLNRSRASAADSLHMALALALATRRWPQADTLLKRTGDKRLMQHYQPVLTAGTSVHYRNPLLAASLSAVVPGAGKVYAGQWKDGLFSLLFVAANAYQSYRGFHQQGEKSVRGWIFGGLALGFYTGNVYGSAQAVKRYNRRQDAKTEELLRQAMEKAF